MTSLSQGDEPGLRLRRRQLLVAGGLTMASAASAPLVACSPAPQPPPPPDPLEPLAKRAGADATLAGMISATYASLAQSMAVVTTIRNEHAAALERELDRVRPGRARTSASASPGPASGVPHTVSVPPDLTTALTSMMNALLAAEKEAADAVLTLPMYRAGLVGSIAAACACVREALS